MLRRFWRTQPDGIQLFHACSIGGVLLNLPPCAYGVRPNVDDLASRRPFAWGLFIGVAGFAFVSLTVLLLTLLQAYLGHRNIQHTVRYTELSPTRFRNFWRE